MKKIIALILAAVMLLTFAACGTTEATEQEEQAAEEVVFTTEQQEAVDIVQRIMGNVNATVKNVDDIVDALNSKDDATKAAGLNKLESYLAAADSASDEICDKFGDAFETPITTDVGKFVWEANSYFCTAGIMFDLLLEYKNGDVFAWNEAEQYCTQLPANKGRATSAACDYLESVGINRDQARAIVFD